MNSQSYNIYWDRTPQSALSKITNTGALPIMSANEAKALEDVALFAAYPDSVLYLESYDYSSVNKMKAVSDHAMSICFRGVSLADR